MSDRLGLQEDRMNPKGECVSEVIDAEHLAHQREWSEATFGPGTRTLGVIDHIRKELTEIEADPTDLAEWVDVIILAFDGAWRAGWEPQQIIDAVKAKQAKNEAREWPDWRTASPDQAIEHERWNDAYALAVVSGQYGCDDPVACLEKGHHRYAYAAAKRAPTDPVLSPKGNQ